MKDALHNLWIVFKWNTKVGNFFLFLERCKFDYKHFNTPLIWGNFKLTYFDDGD